MGPVEDAGVPKIATMLNLTRLHNSVAAVAGMRRGLALARAYAGVRNAFGERLADLALHAETLTRIAVQAEGGFALAFRVAELCGRVEAGDATVDEVRLLRILTPLAKLFTGKQAVSVASEVLECFGGAGYIEDTGIPRLLRDAQVLPLWEGTTNVLSLDMLRAMSRDDAVKPLLDDIGRMLVDAHRVPELAGVVEEVGAAVTALGDRLAAMGAQPRQVVEAGARELAFALAAGYIGALLAEAAAWAAANSPERAVGATETARRWATTMAPVV